MNPSKHERFLEFLRRLAAAPAADSFASALGLLCETLNAVEDEWSGIPYDINHWETDGRMYPPQEDSLRDVPGRDGVKRFRSIGHNTLIALNGALEIREVISDDIVLQKHGADGRGIWEAELPGNEESP